MYVQSLWIASLFSLVTIILCLQFYMQLTVVMIDVADKLWFMSAIPINLPRVSMAFATLATLVGVLCGLAIVHSPRQSVGCIVSAVAMVGLSIIFVCCRVIRPINGHLNEKVASIKARRLRAAGEASDALATQEAAQGGTTQGV